LVLSAQQGPCLTYIHTSDSCNSHCSSVLLTTTMTPAVEAALSHNPKTGMQQCPDPEWVPLPGPHCGSSCSKSLGHTAGADALVYPQLVRLHAAALLDLNNLGLGGIPTWRRSRWKAGRADESAFSKQTLPKYADQHYRNVLEDSPATCCPGCIARTPPPCKHDIC
jgi:hypothetical protein